MWKAFIMFKITRISFLGGLKSTLVNFSLNLLNNVFLKLYLMTAS